MKPDPFWQALCRGYDPDIWFSDPEYAKTICTDCPIKASCYQRAADRGEQFGVWGGVDFETAAPVVPGLFEGEEFESELSTVSICPICEGEFTKRKRNQLYCGRGICETVAHTMHCNQKKRAERRAAAEATA